MLWQHIMYMCVLFLVQEGMWTGSPCIYELYVFPDDDKRYAIETCRSSESVLKVI